MTESVIVREWDPELFHRRVADLEAQGFTPLQETYRITPEMDPETGVIVHLHYIEMRRPSGTE